MIGPRRQREWRGRRAENVQPFISLALQSAGLVVSLNTLKPRCWSLPFPKLCIGKDGKGPSDDWTASATRLVTSQSRECPTVHKSSVADRKFGCITQYIEKPRCWSLPFPKLCVVKDGKGPSDDWTASATRLVTSQSRECPTVHKSSVADRKFGCITQYIENRVAGAFLSLNCVSARTGKGPEMNGPRRQRCWRGRSAENLQPFVSLPLQTASLVVSLNRLKTALLEP